MKQELNSNENRKEQFFEILEDIRKKAKNTRTTKDWINIKDDLNNSIILVSNFIVEHSNLNIQKIINVLNKQTLKINEMENDFYLIPTEKKRSKIEKEIETAEKYINACRLISRFVVNENDYVEMRNIMGKTASYLASLPLPLRMLLDYIKKK